MVEKHTLIEFEKKLDTKLNKCSVFSSNASESLAFFVNLSDFLAHQAPENNSIDLAIIIMAKYLVSGKMGKTILNDKTYTEDIIFCAHYYMLREYLYYSFNFENAFDWSFGENHVEIRFLDPSIPRQFYTSDNEYYINSYLHFKEFSLLEEIRKYILLIDEFEESEKSMEVLKMIEEEARHKLSAYFSIIDQNSDIDLGGFTYADFFKIYHILVSKALWHRHFGEVHNKYGAINICYNDLIEVCCEKLKLDKNKVVLIFNNLIFDNQAVKDRLDASYFSLIADPHSKNIWMRPFHFSLYEGLVGFLKVVAIRRPQLFLNNVSNTLGGNFVKRIQESFSAQGFYCQREINLTNYDSTLPDIDLLVISEEPTLGFVLLVCEIKSPIPAKWAKDHLKALNTDNVSKAFKQSQKISEFLRSSNGISLLTQLLHKKKLPEYDHFVVVLQPVIITSHNSGMFFEKENTPIFSYRTIEQILAASDGDMAYIQYFISHYNRDVDKIIKTKIHEVDLGGYQVRYEVVDDSPRLFFPPNQWRSSSQRAQVINDFHQSSFTPKDAFDKNFFQLLKKEEKENYSTNGKSVILFDISSDAKYLRQIHNELNTHLRDVDEQESD